MFASSISRPGSPPLRKNLRILQDRLHHNILQIRRITVVAQDALHQHAYPGVGGIAPRPVDANVLLALVGQHRSDDPELPVAPDLYRDLAGS